GAGTAAARPAAPAGGDAGPRRPGPAAAAARRAVGPGQRLRPPDARDAGAAAAADRHGPDAGPRPHGAHPAAVGPDAAAVAGRTVHAAAHARPAARPAPGPP